MQFPLSSLRERCLATLAYFDLFDYPLTLEELHRYFLGEQPVPRELKLFLEEHGDIIGSQDGYYFLRGRDLIVVTRDEREKNSLRFWKKVRRYLPFIQFVPFIRMVAVCNTMAINNATTGSDIDLFIVAKPGRLFFVRFLTVALFSVLGVRRHGTKTAGRFCLSFYCDETVMDLESIQTGADDVYLPYWILTMKPLYGRDTYEKFAKANVWIARYFGRTLSLAHDFWSPNVLRFLAWLKEFLWRGKLGDLIEKRLMNSQMKRHRSNLASLPSGASVVVSEHMLKFHNIDRRKDIAVRFEARLRELLGERR